MKTATLNNTLIDSYFGLLNNLSQLDKLDLIAKLTASVKVVSKTEQASKKASFKKAFGAWESKDSAEEIIEEIRSSRVFNRQIESF